MKRRDFLYTFGTATAGALFLPTILPSGSLFAKTSTQKVKHVVLCLFAGGVRNIESVHQETYGNLMPGMLDGTPAEFPNNELDPLPSFNLLSSIQTPLQQYGTLFKEFRYSSGPPGHFNGHTVAITGVYTDTGLNLRENPNYPTIFEYYRKHNTPIRTAMNAWWISNTLGPYPALNFSKHPSYGADFGANFLAPTQLINPTSYEFIGNAKAFTSEEEQRMKFMREFLDNNFKVDYLTQSLGIANTPAEAEYIRDFIRQLFERALQGEFSPPMNVTNFNNDILNIVFAEEVLKTFQPELLVVNMQNVDICHQNFTAYCNNLQKADYAVAHLWNTIQSTPGLMDDTVMIVVPEHGRNLQPNTIKDEYGRLGLDHTNEASNTSREIFCLILGPPNVVKQNQVIGTADQPVGESIDVAMTIAELLGFRNQIPSQITSTFLNGRVLEEAFV